MLNKSSKARAAIYELGHRPDGNRKSMFADAARAAGITWRQARSLFYGEPVHPALADKVRAAADAKARAAADAKARKEARNEYVALLARIERIEAALRLSDEEFHGGQVDALREIGRSVHRAVD